MDIRTPLGLNLCIFSPDLDERCVSLDPQGRCTPKQPNAADQTPPPPRTSHKLEELATKVSSVFLGEKPGRRPG
uniref:Uncharacterized protein n=1 Tax=Timema cristinae TaxID=61476 RepID=A0A7R9D4D0_TIMCR|nr:unnamed protein product [Timema cristinae]